MRLSPIELATIVDAAVVTPANNGAEEKVERACRLLVAEDDKHTLAVLSRLLRQRGHNVQTAHTMEAALALAANHRFDLVISDLGLPDGHGTELMMKLARDYGLRGVELSGYGMEQDLAKTTQAGFIAHLIKPVQFEQFSRGIRLAADEAA